LTLKIHALLCRPYTKGRDWYDFNWYVRKKIKPNLPLLRAALIQDGPWKGQDLKINEDWVKQSLSQKISSIDWKGAATDIERFLSRIEKDGLKMWNEQFFTQKAEQLFD